MPEPNPMADFGEPSLARADVDAHIVLSLHHATDHHTYRDHDSSLRRRCMLRHRWALRGYAHGRFDRCDQDALLGTSYASGWGARQRYAGDGFVGQNAAPEDRSG